MLSPRWCPIVLEIFGYSICSVPEYTAIHPFGEELQDSYCHGIAVFHPRSPVSSSISKFRIQKLAQV